MVKVGDLELCFLNPDDVESELIISSFSQALKSEEDESDVSKAVDGHSDLIPMVYEGKAHLEFHLYKRDRTLLGW